MGLELAALLGSAGVAGTAAGVGALASGVSGLLSALNPPDAPKLPEPTAIPDEEASRAAKRKALAGQQGRSGRQSTMLTALNSGGLGG